ncbi:MAG: DUF4912 domain-containing protein [Clostridia bacterium]|nr:DUF4912 domain-containing protein [Clostridia bacterium]
MPRKAKDERNLIESKNNIKKENINKNVNTKSKITTKKTTVKKQTSKKADTRTTPTKRSISVKKSSKNVNVEVAEYYDLPYHYNKTVVKVLAQTPTTLFVYWDISDEDKENYIKQYGEFFFNDTKPILVVHNNTKNYSFEVDINDFANSWYIHVLDSDCDYSVELARRPINKYAKSPDFLQISSSNDIKAPNNHILFDSLNNNVYFRNVKTNVTSEKDISLSSLSRVGKIYNAKNFYENMYKDEYIDFDRLDFKRLPSS